MQVSEVCSCLGNSGACFSQQQYFRCPVYILLLFHLCIMGLFLTSRTCTFSLRTFHEAGDIEPCVELDMLDS